MAKKRVLRAWTKDDMRVLKTGAKARLGAPKIARTLERTVGAVRQKAFALGVSLDMRA
jgi:hypothetical protein